MAIDSFFNAVLPGTLSFVAMLIFIYGLFQMLIGGLGIVQGDASSVKSLFRREKSDAADDAQDSRAEADAAKAAQEAAAAAQRGEQTAAQADQLLQGPATPEQLLAAMNQMRENLNKGIQEAQRISRDTKIATSDEYKEVKRLKDEIWRARKIYVRAKEIGNPRTMQQYQQVMNDKRAELDAKTKELETQMQEERLVFQVRDLEERASKQMGEMVPILSRLKQARTSEPNQIIQIKQQLKPHLENYRRIMQELRQVLQDFYGKEFGAISYEKRARQLGQQAVNLEQR